MTVSVDLADKIRACHAKHPDWRPGRIADATGGRVPDVLAIVGSGAKTPVLKLAKDALAAAKAGYQHHVQIVNLGELASECQVRDEIDAETVEDYAEAMREGVVFPPIVVFRCGGSLLLADGFHRVDAALACGFQDIKAEVHVGNRLDAIKYALGANRAHGLRYNNADKRKAVRLAIAEFPDLSLRDTASLIGVSQEFVRKLKAPPVLSTVDSNPGADRSGHSNVGGHNDGKTGSGKPKAKASADPMREDGMSPDSLTKDGVDGDMDPLVNSLAAIWRRATNEQKRDFIAWVEDNGGVPTEE